MGFRRQRAAGYWENSTLSSVETPWLLLGYESGHVILRSKGDDEARFGGPDTVHNRTILTAVYDWRIRRLRRSLQAVWAVNTSDWRRWRPR